MVSIETLPDFHQRALRWFIEHAGTEQPWKNPLEDGTLIANKAEGIYVPKQYRYAVSVKHTLSGRYQDILDKQASGSWSFDYQEQTKMGKSGLALYTNRSLVACMEDQVPVGVMVQISTKHDPQGARYYIPGLARIQKYENGLFTLVSTEESLTAIAKVPIDEAAVKRKAEEVEAHGGFDPASPQEGKSKVLQAITQRQGQPKFRKALIEAYQGQCAISGCNAQQALEAAHILPYNGTSTNHPSNGLLLRADLHTLFDLHSSRNTHGTT